MDGRMHARTNVPEAICPANFFEVGGIKKLQEMPTILEVFFLLTYIHSES